MQRFGPSRYAIFVHERRGHHAVHSPRLVGYALGQRIFMEWKELPLAEVRRRFGMPPETPSPPPPPAFETIGARVRARRLRRSLPRACKKAAVQK